eukprot:scaffold1069_cov390-Prasinococcus_capsulatus_cf.AAC.3
MPGHIPRALATGHPAPPLSAPGDSPRVLRSRLFQRVVRGTGSWNGHSSPARPRDQRSFRTTRDAGSIRAGPCQVGILLSLWGGGPLRYGSSALGPSPVGAVLAYSLEAAAFVPATEA